MKEELHIAKWWEKQSDDKILCTLCPRYCKLMPGQKGFCFVRENIDGQLYSIGYGRPTGFAVDPIEKKPLFHFYPGSDILSFGTAGCNLGCKFCQNWSMSKAKVDEINSLNVTPENVISLAKKYKAKSIAFTYNEPTIFGEFVIDVSQLARQEGIKTVMVTAGYIDKEARKDIYKYIVAANVDLKGFTEYFYHHYTWSHLKDVLDTLIWLKNETNIWLEVTNLIIPTLNDNQSEIESMIDWILNNLGDEIPLHFSAFRPAFKLTDIPATPASTVKLARETALKKGIKYVYVGNISDNNGSTTFCPNCKTKLIERDWHSVKTNNIYDGKCNKCGTVIGGLF